MYTEFRIPSNVICAESFKNLKHFKNQPPEIKILRNFVTPKVAEFPEIPWNSTNAVIQNSVEFRAIPYTLRNIQNKKKRTEFRVSGIPKTPNLFSPVLHLFST